VSPRRGALHDSRRLERDAPAASHSFSAVGLGEETCELLERLGQVAYLSTVAVLLADAYYEPGPLDDADLWAGRAEALGASDDTVTQCELAGGVDRIVRPSCASRHLP
jgi:hypothetical protein